MAKLTLTDLGTTLANTAATVLNNNDALIETAFENTLSRDGTGPNQMEADIDLNNNDLLNVNVTNTTELYVDGLRTVPGEAVNAANFATAAQGAKADSAMQPAVYDPSNVAGNVYDRKFSGDFDTEAEFVAAGIPAVVSYVETAGYYVPGDGGGHRKLRVGTPSPAEAWHKQSADGAWWEVRTETMNPHILGAAGDNSNDDGQAIEDSLAYCKLFLTPLQFFAATYKIVDREFYLDFPVTIFGAGRESTRLIFHGTPPKTKRTRVVWKAAYDSGDYSSESDDPAIGCAFVLNDQNIRITDMLVHAFYTALADYPLPFDSATDYPTSDYDNAFLILFPNCFLERVETSGPWGNFGSNGGLRIDNTVSGSAEHIRVSESIFRGRWGVALTGPLGPLISGEDYTEMVTADTRGGGGWSDTTFDNVECYDTGIRLTIDGNANRRVKRLASTGGALYVNGQISLNTAKRQQQLTFKRCRFANIDEYTIYVNYCNRTTFFDCHTEYVSGSYLEDGVTPQTSGDNQGRWTTANARQILFNGGEYSGEQDNMVYSSGTIRIITELGFSGVTTRTISGYVSRDKRSWTPTVIGSGGGSATISTAYGSYVRQGNLVTFQARIQLSAVGTLTGNVIIAGLPYTAANPDPFADWIIPTVTGSVTVGDAGVTGLLSNAASQIDLYKVRSAATLQNIALADITATSLIFVSGSYITDDAEV